MSPSSPKNATSSMKQLFKIPYEPYYTNWMRNQKADLVKTTYYESHYTYAVEYTQKPGLYVLIQRQASAQRAMHFHGPNDKGRRHENHKYTQIHSMNYRQISDTSLFCQIGSYCYSKCSVVRVLTSILQLSIRLSSPLYNEAIAGGRSTRTWRTRHVSIR